MRGCGVGGSFLGIQVNQMIDDERAARPRQDGLASASSVGPTVTGVMMIDDDD